MAEVNNCNRGPFGILPKVLPREAKPLIIDGVAPYNLRRLKVDMGGSLHISKKSSNFAL